MNNRRIFTLGIAGVLGFIGLAKADELAVGAKLPTISAVDQDGSGILEHRGGFLSSCAAGGYRLRPPSSSAPSSRDVGPPRPPGTRIRPFPVPFPRVRGAVGPVPVFRPTLFDQGDRP